MNMLSFWEMALDLRLWRKARSVVRYIMHSVCVCVCVCNSLKIGPQSCSGFKIMMHCSAGCKFVDERLEWP